MKMLYRKKGVEQAKTTAILRESTADGMDKFQMHSSDFNDVSSKCSNCKTITDDI